MAQRQLPMFPEGSTEVTHDLAFEKRDGSVTYFYGSLPVFTHNENDAASFKMITAQFYINGYVKQMDIVRVYNGQQTKLPRHHVARQKLCLRPTTDYWVNAMDGQPFMVINKAVDPGMIKVIENDILPQLEKRLPTFAENQGNVA
ncbi:putative transposase [Bathymodiolus platifrons methanotrophic gill symbiont]|uniref:putative transposase n=1 Tax=Bathymodiolus platifrons methanotrophic gill symbiont TaxID=113268 RepID=UPI001C8DAB87|nr:hypothetical protein [Bathymodiolus platifrons methanotrophic gill symbiont]